MQLSDDVSEEFLDWLDKCPVTWCLLEEGTETLTYGFVKNEGQHDE